MRVWKWVGLAGLAGVAATGVAVARAERRRAAYTPDQVRERLHARLEAAREEPPPPPPEPTGRLAGLRARLTRRGRRGR
jgi:hypothetical protein